MVHGWFNLIRCALYTVKMPLVLQYVYVYCTQRGLSLGLVIIMTRGTVEIK